MGFTGLARWINAPVHGSLNIITNNILDNHNGKVVGQWSLNVKAYRSTLTTIPGVQLFSERSMCTLQMNENVFVLLEDPMAPSRADVLAADLSNPVNAHLVNPTHYRTTFLTLRPPLALEQLLSQLKARWVPARQSAAQGPQRNQAISGQQLTIEGVVFAIGTDWLVRAGNVMLSTREMKGMLIEAEYLPVATLHSPIADGTAELLSNLLTAILPNKPDAKTVAVTISDAQWEDVLWDREEEEEMARQQESQPPAEDDIYAYGDELVPAKVKGDWVGVDRDRRSAYLIMGALRSEGIL